MAFSYKEQQELIQQRQKSSAVEKTLHKRQQHHVRFRDEYNIEDNLTDTPSPSQSSSQTSSVGGGFVVTGGDTNNLGGHGYNNHYQKHLQQ